MAQHDMVVDNGPGLTVRSDFNAALAAVFSSNSGDVQPATRVAGMLWFDTSTAGVTQLKVRDQANATWVSLNLGGTAGDQTISNNYIVDRPSASPALGFGGSLASFMRWRIVPGNATAESTGNAGSDFAFERYSDAGSLIDTAVTITRSTGRLNALKGMAVTGGLIADTLDLTTPLPVADGGTGGTTQATARTGLGLGSMSTQVTTTYYTKTETDNAIAAATGGGGTGGYTDLGVTAKGAIIMAIWNGTGNVAAGATVAGSTLSPANANGIANSGARAGTWRCLGGANSASTSDRVTIFQRIT